MDTDRLTAPYPSVFICGETFTDSGRRLSDMSTPPKVSRKLSSLILWMQRTNRRRDTGSKVPAPLDRFGDGGLRAANNPSEMNPD